MLYTTTRRGQEHIEGSQAILNGLGADGGLYLPEAIPHFTEEELKTLMKMDYNGKAKVILGEFLTDFTQEEIQHCVDAAYNQKSFSDPAVTPLRSLNDRCAVLELYHGPTSAFKDVALQILPHLLTTSARKNGDKRTFIILVATSGDTGKAALEGFKDVPGIKIMVFYPNDGVSLVQKLQMSTQEGSNLQVLSVEGNFDDTQNGVKALFSDVALNQLLEKNGMTFSSANSINWGRLVPQIVYYFEAYAQKIEEGSIAFGDEINFTVPTGNFGNILAGYYAKEMGLPIRRLICAANQNDVLKDFIRSGIYDRNRPFHKTHSPSMDILISSNLERLLYLISDQDKSFVSQLMDELKDHGVYTIHTDLLKKIQKTFWSDSCGDPETTDTIRQVYDEYGYLLDTHTAVAYGVYEKYVMQTEDKTPNVIVSTASPYKFNLAVGEAILQTGASDDELKLLEEIRAKSGMPIPLGLTGLDQKTIRFREVIPKDQMKGSLMDYLGLK